MSIEDNGSGVTVHTESGQTYEGAALIGCDGLWSTVRQHIVGDGKPAVSGHIAYRAVLPTADWLREYRLPKMIIWCTAGELQQMTWYALFAKDYTKALAVTDHAHALFPDNLGVETNRAHVLMFTGHDEEAKALYLVHKGEVREPSGKLWEQVIAQDFAAFRKAGFIEKELGISR